MRRRLTDPHAVGRVLVFVVVLVGGRCGVRALGLATWSPYVIGAVAGLAGSSLLGDADRLPDPFDEPARPDRPPDSRRR